MKNKKAIIISIITIALLIGGSFAYWMLNLSQTTTNNIATSCFNISLSENNAINLQNAFPMRDSEGGLLTPYEFTITNNCSTYAYYEVNLEVLNTTNLNSEYIKIKLDDENPLLLSNKTETTTTLSNASSSYRLKTAYLHASESKTYNLRLWLDENVTLSDNVTEKEFYGKITIRATYKPDAPTQMEECEAQYGEGATICSFIAQADPTNNKCLKVDENGMIIDPYSTMSDEERPIICTMEDDYGTSYYLRGNHQDNNVKYANMCWKLIRITGTSGYKLIYNGDLDANGKCTTTSGNHTGFTGQNLSLSGNKLYGTSYTKEGSTYTLTDTSTLNWTNDKASIIGKYTCGNTGTSCTDLYVVLGEYSSTYGYALKLGQSTNYAQIGASAFNLHSRDSDSTESASPALVGYMYNDTYPNKSRNLANNGNTIITISTSSSSYYYGDSISYSGGYYYITNHDNSDVVQLNWENNYQNNLVGKYTCRETIRYNNKTIRCTTAYKVLDTTTRPNYMISESLSDGRLATGIIKLSNEYTDNGDGTYTINTPITEISAMEWYNSYSSYNNYYVCEDWNQTTCNKLYKIINASQVSFKTELLVSNSYYYGSSFSYTEGAPNPYTLNDTVQFFDIVDSTNITSLNTHHYTCFNVIDNTCNELFFIYYLSGTTPYYIKLNGNETGLDALNKMINNNDINVKNSHIKGAIDWWYKQNLNNTPYESYLEDTIFCNDRTIDDIGGWSETGTLGPLYFNAYNDKYYLKCPNKRDAFTVSDNEKGNGALTYPIGLLTTAESSLIGNYKAQNIGLWYWSSAPAYFLYYDTFENGVGSGGRWSLGVKGNSIYGVRPSISLKPGTKFIAGGDGTASNPYEVDTDN